MAELQFRITNIKEEKISGENVYLFLHYYGTMYKEFTDERKKFFNTFIESIEIFKEERPDGRLLKCINFKFPFFYDGNENVTHICWDSETTAESMSEKEKDLVRNGAPVIFILLKSSEEICSFNTDNYEPPEDAYESLARAILQDIIEYFKNKKDDVVE